MLTSLNHTAPLAPAATHAQVGTLRALSLLRGLDSATHRSLTPHRASIYLPAWLAGPFCLGLPKYKETRYEQRLSLLQHYNKQIHNTPWWHTIYHYSHTNRISLPKTFTVVSTPRPLGSFRSRLLKTQWNTKPLANTPSTKPYVLNTL